MKKWRGGFRSFSEKMIFSIPVRDNDSKVQNLNPPSKLKKKILKSPDSPQRRF